MSNWTQDEQDIYLEMCRWVVAGDSAALDQLVAFSLRKKIVLVRTSKRYPDAHKNIEHLRKLTRRYAHRLFKDEEKRKT